MAHTRAWRAHKIRRPSFAPLSAFRYARDLHVDIPVGLLVIPGREKYAPRAARAWLDWFPRISARDLRVGVVGGVIRDETLAEKARMATFLPFEFTAVDTRRKGVARAAERVVTPDDGPGGLWSVRFRRVPDTALVPAPEIPDAMRNLVRALENANAVAITEKLLQQWTPYLDQAIATLRGRGEAATSGDILPRRGYSADAHRLVTAATQAWVLGGIMSWNDHEPRGKEIASMYYAATADLYGCLIEAVASAVNNGLDK